MIKKRSRIDQSEEARLERVASLRFKTGKKLSALSVSYLNSENLVGNIENFIGSTSLPLGLSGPLKIHFEHGTEEISAAFATSEGALVSSISRGVLALNLSQGVTTRCLENTVTRAPAFLFNDLNQALRFAQWLPSQVSDLRQKTKEHSKHAVLIDIQIKVIVNEVHTIFSYTTGEAAGQNMTTLITASLVQTIRQKYLNFEKYWIENTLIEGNVASDKKVSASLFSSGRGRKVIAEVKIPSAVIQKVFKVNALQFSKNFNRMKTARVFAGYQGFNINVANVVAGLFLATGQDAACIHESSVAELHIEMQGEDLYASLYMPSIIVGTIGGGTHLPHAKSCLDLMSCEGLKSADKLAQIICAYALALDLSTSAAVEGGHFVQAHSALGRDSLKNFKPDEINADFINTIAINSKDKIINCLSVESVDFDDAMMMDLASISARRISGLFRLSVEVENEGKTKNLILKIKNSDSDLISSSHFMLQNLDMEQIALSDEFKTFHPFLNSQKNEINVNLLLNQINWQFVPPIRAATIKNQVGFLLQDEVVGAIKKFNHWTEAEINLALKNLATIHTEKMLVVESFSDYKKSKSLWIDLAQALLFKKTNQDVQKIFNFCISNYDSAFADFLALEKRFCHLDYNPRNLLFKEQHIFVIDWEFSGLHLPQRDLIEFLIFNYANISDSKMNQLINDYPQQIKYPSDQWQKGLRPAYIDFVLRRLSLYLVISEFKDIHFLNDLVSNCAKFLDHFLDPNELRK